MPGWALTCSRLYKIWRRTLMKLRIWKQLYCRVSVKSSDWMAYVVMYNQRNLQFKAMSANGNRDSRLCICVKHFPSVSNRISAPPFIIKENDNAIPLLCSAEINSIILLILSFYHEWPTVDVSQTTNLATSMEEHEKITILAKIFS